MLLQVLLAHVGIAVASVPYLEYVLTPKSRTIRPASVYNVNGTVASAKAVFDGSQDEAIFSGLSAVTYDFGKEVAGIVSFSIQEASDDSRLGISFTESSMWINSDGCDATADAGIDVPLWWDVQSGRNYTAEAQYQRGGFRYLNVYHNGTGNTSLSDLTIYYTAIPHISDEQLAAGIQTGYFHCDDELLNRIWYAGAYTNELCTIDPTKGDSLIHLGTVNSSSIITEPLVWYNNYTVSNGTAVLVDGAKRDRLVWPGDILISQPGIFVSSYDMDMLRDSLDSLLVMQNASGALPYAGRPFGELIPVWSFTYHLHSLSDIYQYYTYTGNETYIERTWDVYKKAMNFSLSFIDETGLAYVTTSADWLRFGMGARNIEANAILYHNLNIGIGLAARLNDTSAFVQTWPTIAERIKVAANELLWDADANLYRDNNSLPLTDLHPQDGNSWAIVSNITSSLAQAANISKALQARWGEYGAPAPEAGATVSPFVGGFELQAHFLAGRPEAAIALTRLQWGFMLDDPRMTNSSFIEGYSTDGSLHYAPYTNDPRVSHAHGWATGPTSTLTFLAAGLQVISGAGREWLIEPQLGGLQTVEAGFQTNAGSFSSHVSALSNRGLNVTFSTPADSSGTVRLRHNGTVESLTVQNLNGNTSSTKRLSPRQTSSSGTSSVLTLDGLTGGNYTIILQTSS